MIILNDYLIDEEINKMLNQRNFLGEPYYKLSEEDIDKIKPMFKSLMQQEININKTPKQQVSLIDALIEGFDQKADNIGWTDQKIYNQYSDMKHIYQIDEFIGDGEAQKIIDSLTSRGIPTSALKGLALGQEYNTVGTPNQYGIEIYEHIERIDGGSPEVVELDIYLDGKLIYSYQQDEESFVDIEEIKEQEIIQPQNRTSKYKGIVFTEEEEEVKEWTDKNGRTFYTNAKGYRISRNRIL